MFKKKWIILLLFFAISLFVSKQHLVVAFQVDGSSMLPNFHNGDQVLLNKLAYDFQPPKYGDVIIFQSPDMNDQYLIKRVIGLPGDTIEVNNSQVIRNGVPLLENYLLEPMIDYMEITYVPDGSVFVMGDNRNISLDSRNSHIGPVYQSLILGRVDYKYQINGTAQAWEATPHLQPLEELPTH
ncbi:MAG TPA: signal peptidase I [Bacillota bacterium]|nr:signal peptidase I [Bacillota bacterium]